MSVSRLAPNIIQCAGATIPSKFKRSLFPLPFKIILCPVSSNSKEILCLIQALPVHPHANCSSVSHRLAGAFQVTQASLPSSFHLHLLERFWGFRIRTVPQPVLIHGLSSARCFILIASGNKYKAKLPMSWTRQRWDGWGRPNATSQRWVRNSSDWVGGLLEHVKKEMITPSYFHQVNSWNFRWNIMKTSRNTRVASHQWWQTPSLNE